MAKENRNTYDASFIFPEKRVCSTGRDIAEKLTTLLARFSHIKHGCCGKRVPEIYVPAPNYVSDVTERKKALKALHGSGFIFVIITDCLSADTTHVDEIEASFREALHQKKRQHRLIPVYLSRRTVLRIAEDTVPFGLDGVVGINVAGLAGHRTLLDVDEHRVKAKDLDMMCVQKFTGLLNHSLGVQQRKPVSEETKMRRLALYKYAHEKLAEFRTQAAAKQMTPNKSAIQ